MKIFANELLSQSLAIKPTCLGDLIWPYSPSRIRVSNSPGNDIWSKAKVICASSNSTAEELFLVCQFCENSYVMTARVACDDLHDTGDMISRSCLSIHRPCSLVRAVCNSYEDIILCNKDEYVRQGKRDKREIHA